MRNTVNENPKIVTDKTIQTFVMRSGRMTEAQKRAYSLYAEKWCIEFKNEILNMEKVFSSKNPLTIEIGFGTGIATALIAKQNPKKNYIGIEVFKAGVGKLLDEIENNNLSNLRIIEYDAIEVLEKMIEDNSVEAFHIFFPDPWQKKRHNKRRLVHRPRTDLLQSKLKKNGYIYMVTDWEDYAEDAFEQLSSTPNLKSKYEKFAPPQSWRPKTKFEKKGTDKNHKITEIIFEKI